MNNEIRIIRKEQEKPNQPNQSKPQNIKKEVITQNSPILKQLKEAEERYKLRKKLSVDELIELEFKDIADKIRAERKEQSKNNSDESKNLLNEYTEINNANLNNSNSSDTIKEIPIKEIPIDDKSLAYIRDLDEPILPNFNNDNIRLKFNEGLQTKYNDTLHREPIKRDSLNKFTASVNNMQNSDFNNSNMSSSVDENMSLIDRLRMDRQKIYESKKNEIKKIEITPPLKNDDNDGILPNLSVNDISSNDCSVNDNIDKIKDSIEYEADELSCIASNLSLESIVGASSSNIQDKEDPSNISELSESGGYKLPHIGLLDEPKYQKVDVDGSEIDLKAQNLISKLRVFRINGDVTDIYSGPVVTTFEFRPAPDVKVSRIQNLENDLSMTLKAKSIRIQAPIPGKDVVGIEIPNNTIQTIYIREIFESQEFINSDAQLAIALGKDIIGKPVVQDLAKLPHLLIAGTTGSGKSVGLNGMILSLLYRNTPEELRFIMIDPKRVELSLYKDIPHLLTPIIADPKKAVIALSKAVDEMNRRYELMNESGVKNIIGYNEVAKQKGFDKLPYIVIIIDEFADLMIMGGKDSEQYLTSLASKARASGIHLIIATQRPTVNVVTGLIKSNLPSRISYRVGSPMDSKVVLDKVGAETLLGNGDMLFSNTNVVSRYHAPYSNEKEIERVANFIRSQRSVEYDEFFSLEPKEIIQTIPQNSTPMSEDEYMEKAKEIILSSGRTSASYLQRMLGIGFNRASNILETLEREGFLSAPNSKNIREIIG